MYTVLYSLHLGMCSHEEKGSKDERNIQGTHLLSAGPSESVVLRPSSGNSQESGDSNMWGRGMSRSTHEDVA